MPEAKLYNDNLLNEQARRVFHKAMTKCEELLDAETCSPDRLMAYAQVADAAVGQIIEERRDDDEDDDPYGD